MAFLVLKLIHVLAAIAAAGASMTYVIWRARARREPEVLPFVLRSVSLIDQRLANPCYATLLVTGLIMALTLSIPLTTPRLLTAMVLYVFATLLGIFAYAPATRQQRRLLETAGVDSQSYKGLAQRSAKLGILVRIDVLFTVFLMVIKPALWR